MLTVLPDHLSKGLTVVFCGTAAGTASALRAAYYAGSGNQFWPTLRAVGLTPCEYDPQDFRQLITHGIGLTDIAQHTHGNDSSLKKDDFDVEGFKVRMIEIAPRLIAFNGKKAASLFLAIPTGKISYGLQKSEMWISKLFVLPSTSGAARRYWDVAHWHELANLIRLEKE